MSEATPMMAQYRRIKAEHRDAILFFRLGDFYEMFEQDALEASRLLDLTLTQRQGVPMCGIPYHAAEGYIARLLRRGRKIAVCEQTQLPEGRGLANREVIEIISPGTVVDEGFLDRTANNYLVALSWVGGHRGAGRVRGGSGLPGGGAAAPGSPLVGLACLDLSTSDFAATSFPLEGSRERIRKELLRLAPRELLVQESLLEENENLKGLLLEQDGLVINRYPDWSFDPESNRSRLQHQLGVINLKGFGLEDDAPEITAAGVLLEYVGESSRSLLPHIRGIQVYAEDTYVGLDEASQRNLELVQNLQDRTRRYTLLETLDHTRSAMGTRQLRRWILQPLRSIEEIEKRQRLVEFLYHNQVLLSRLREKLKGMFDLERLSARVALEKAHAKDLLAIRGSLETILALNEELQGQPEAEPITGVFASHRTEIDSLLDLLGRAILDEPAVLLSEGNLIRPGYHEELDRLRRLKENARSILEEYLARERESTGIASLKLRYNRILGYFLEVTKANLHLVPAHFIRRQSLVNGERYTTEVLSERESEILNASEQIVGLERELFLEVRKRVRQEIGALLELSAAVSRLDVLQSFAFAATVHGYVRPRLVNEPVLHIEEGRHPVVESHLPVGAFVPNDLHLDPRGAGFVLLTGPNMAGKSTFLRQVALIALMAQIGSFVPAREAEIGVVDRIFCRVGASDNLARGESTFLVEMNETANILRAATPQSLIILDEVGRGTSTGDGLAIAWAVTEHILEHIRARSLFATHFHEMTALVHAGLKNLSMRVLETDDEIVFLKKVQEGPADSSYGIHVARLAGIPEAVLRRALEIQARIGNPQEAAAAARARGVESDPPAATRAAAQPALFSALDLVRDEIAGLNLERLTPLEALNRIARWQEELRREG